MIRFVWYDLMTLDIDSAVAFYTETMAWEAVEVELPDRRYVVFTNKGKMIAGISERPKNISFTYGRAFWLGYLAIYNVDLYTQEVVTAGGRVLLAPHDVPEVGRLSIVADSEGGAFAFFDNPQVHQMQYEIDDLPKIGRFTRHELWTTNEERSEAFYADTVNWKSGIYTKLAPVRVARWHFGVQSDGLAAHSQRVVDCGGELIGEAEYRPDGALVQVCVDPLGARFELLGEVEEVIPDHMKMPSLV